MVPDDELTYQPARQRRDDIGLVGLQPNDPGDDRIELSFAAQRADAPLYYVAISSVSPCNEPANAIIRPPALARSM